MSFSARRLPAFLVLLFAALLAGCSNAYQREEEVYLQARQVSDMAALRLGDLTEGNWVVARLTMNPTHATLSGAYVDETGYHQPPDSHWELIKSGTCTVLEVLHGEVAQRQWEFTWNEPDYLAYSFSPPPSTYIHVMRPGLYILRVDRQKTGRDQFPMMLALPPQWQAFPKPALETYCAFRAALGNTNQAQPGMLQQFFDDPNPIVRLDAWHVLVLANDPALVCDRLMRATGTQQGAMLMLLASSLTPTSFAEVLVRLKPALAAQRQPEDVLGLALGAWQAMDGTEDARRFGRAVLDMIPPELARGWSRPAQQLALVLEFAKLDWPH